MKRLGASSIPGIWGDVVKLTVEVGVGGRGKNTLTLFFAGGFAGALSTCGTWCDFCRRPGGEVTAQVPCTSTSTATWSNGLVGNALAAGRDYLSLVISARTVCGHIHQFASVFVVIIRRTVQNSQSLFSRLLMLLFYSSLRGIFPAYFV